MDRAFCEKCGFQSECCTCDGPGGYTYIPVPEWTGSMWVPTNVATERTMQWPEWMTAERIAAFPHPRYMPGEVVRFVWSRGNVHGDIRRIHLHGGRVPVYALEDPDLLIRQKYGRRNMRYTIYWNGHSRWVGEDDIVGRY